MNGKLMLFSIFDQKAEAYMRPFAAPTVPYALRIFADMVQDDSQPVSRHPEDYYLFKVGVMDEASGEIEADHQSLGCAIEFQHVNSELN